MSRLVLPLDPGHKLGHWSVRPPASASSVQRGATFKRLFAHFARFGLDADTVRRYQSLKPRGMSAIRNPSSRTRAAYKLPGQASKKQILASYQLFVSLALLREEQSKGNAMKVKTLILLASSALVLAGCSTGRITDYQPASPAISERTAQASGVEVALDPFVESERTKKYFDINAVANGIAILHVRIVNNTSNQTFLVEKKNFQLVLAGASSGQNADSQTIERSKAGGETVGWVAASAGSLPLMVIASSMISSSMEIQRNFVDKEMPDQTLAPGQNMVGFIYYRPVPKDGGWSRGATIKIRLTETQSHQPVSMTIPLSQ